MELARVVHIDGAQSHQQTFQSNVYNRPPDDTGACMVLAGSLLEGGGQILRNSSALAAITGSSIQVDKIRAGVRVEPAS
jgi:hypothetical protein